MISTDYKFIFVHIAKTGGTSITQVLQKYCDDEVLWRPSYGTVKGRGGKEGVDVFNRKLRFHKPRDKHAPISKYYDRGVKIEDYFKFAVVRNPWDRVVSTSAFAAWKRLTFREMIRRIKNHRRGGDLQIRENIGNYMNRSQFRFPPPVMDYVLVNGKMKIDFFIRYENLQNDFDYVCDKVGIPREKLSQKNASAHEPYSTYYNETVRKFVAKKYKDEIELFNYEFEAQK